MNFTDVLDNLATKGIRVEVAFEDRTILRFMAYGLVAAVIAGVVTALIRKSIA